MSFQSAIHPAAQTSGPAIGTAAFEVEVIKERLDEEWENIFGHALFKLHPQADLIGAMDAIRALIEVGECDGKFQSFGEWFCTVFDVTYLEECGAVYRYGDHPDYGGGTLAQDVEGYRIEMGPLDHAMLCETIGVDNVAAIIKHLTA